MSLVLAVLSVALILLILADAFETTVLPRRVNRRWRLVRVFYRSSWRPWAGVARRMRPGRRRETFLSLFGPLSLLVLLSLWAAGLIAGFALLHFSLGSVIHTTDGPASLSTYFYMSGTTFFTLGYGDVTPSGRLGRFLAVAESGLGFGFLAIVIGYLPVLYQAFSRRETNISLLDARGGSPPSAAQILLRMAGSGDRGVLDRFLEEWERWAAELLENHLSFPMLSYYRSQHDNQSWLAAVTTILDTCALLIAGVKESCPYQARLTFAMARHAVVDLALVFNMPPRAPEPDRLPPARMLRLRETLRQAGVAMRDGEEMEEQLAKLRGMYEPFVNVLAAHLLFHLPPILPETETVDNWQTSAWMRRVESIGQLGVPDPRDEHFD